MKKKLIILSLVMLSSLLLLTWCKKKEKIIITENWDKVTINYDSYLLDGEIIDENKIETIILWQKNSFPIFDTELLWLKTWEEKIFTTKTPNEWYWIYYNTLKVQTLPLTIINKIWTQPKIREQINLWSLNWIITEVSPIDVTIDFNDRQTRENVEFHVRIIDIEKNTVKE